MLLRQAFTNLLRVEEGGAAFVTEEHLLVRDRDSREEELRVELRGTARHGWLELQGRTLLRGDRFSLQDLRGLRLRSDSMWVGGAGVKGRSMSQVGSVNGHIVFTSHQESRHEDKTSQIVNVRWRWDHSYKFPPTYH